MISRHIRTSIVMLHDFMIIQVAFYVSLMLRYEQFIPSPFKSYSESLAIMSVVCFVQLLTFYLTGLYQAVLRFSSTPDLLRIIRGASVGVPFTVLGLFFLNRLEGIPRTVFVMDFLILIVGIGGGRLVYRLLRDHSIQKAKANHKDITKVLIIGAGTAGENLLRDLTSHRSVSEIVVGFVDDDRSKIGKRIRGVNIFGPTYDLERIISASAAKKAFIAIPSATGEQVRKILDICMRSKVEVKILPRISEILDGQVSYTNLRNIEPEDLLGRKSIHLNVEEMENMIHDKVVLITGAGGSIGSELCKQVSLLKPKRLVLFEVTELFLFQLELNLKRDFPEIVIVTVIGDVRNKQKLCSIFSLYRPEVVFHVAAYKHVTMMELNPFEAVQTNIFGTDNIIEVADQFKVQRFVLVSTDKAVNPTNVMGATKRVAELLCQRKSENSNCRFMIVRFGNVLGSSGSVIPLFKNQIERGGPVTVTHPDVTRYFMSIPEACQLIIQAGSMGNGGEVFVLEMGQSVKIVDLAKEMIRLSGRKPGVDIEIEYIGLRAGEKMYEELFYNSEQILGTSHKFVKIARTMPAENDFEILLNFLRNISPQSSSQIIKEALGRLVRDYRYKDETLDNLELQ